MTGNLTPRNQAVLEAMVCLALQLKRCPTVREISDKLGRSRATVQQHISELYLSGYINKRLPGRLACNYKITEKGKMAIRGKKGQMMIKQTDIEVKNPCHCPLRNELEFDGFVIDGKYFCSYDPDKPVSCDNADVFPKDCPLRTQNLNIWRSK